MKITNHGKMAQVRQKLFHSFGSSAVFLDAGVAAVCGLIRDGVFDDVAVTTVAISKKKAETLSLVHFDGRYQQGPERIG